MKGWLARGAGATFALGMMVAVAGRADAAVLYQFTGDEGSFSVVTETFVAAQTHFGPNRLAGCLPAAACPGATFDVGPSSDSIEFSPGTSPAFYWFAQGAFLMPGTYESLAGGHRGRLTVSIVAGVPSGVPEPASWAMMLIGFGAVGGAIRRGYFGRHSHAT